MLSVLTGAGVVEPKVWCGEAKEMERFFAEAAGRKLEVLIVLGGDGTIRTAAEACAEKGSYLIPLPGGTMNMLPRALYGNVSWEESLKKTLTSPSTKVLSGGRVANKRFFIAAIVGAPALWTQPRESMRGGNIAGLYGNVSWEESLKKTLTSPSTKVLSGGRVANKRFFIAAIVGAPALWTQPRESMREGNIADAIKKGGVAFRRTFETKVQYLISGGAKGETEAVALICPLISEEMADSEQALEAAIIDVESAVEVIGLATTAAFGKWRDNRNIHLTKTKRVNVQSSKNIPATLDGESVNLGMRAEIDFVPRVLTVLVPAK